jgi:adenylate cyclase
VTAVNRKLAAILAADAVGFSDQMGADEERTLAVLTVCRKIIDSSVLEHGGRIFGSAGDSVLAEFPSPVEAVRAAVEFQATLKNRNNSVPENQQMTFRVGVNLGDIIVEGDNLYGDGVNIAARLEGICSPGSVFLSAAVHEHIKNKLTCEYGLLGEQALKNIAEPVIVYEVRFDQILGGDDLRAANISDEVVDEPAPDHLLPRLALMPFRSSSQDAETIGFATGLGDDLAVLMGKQTAIDVIDPILVANIAAGSDAAAELRHQAGADYVLEGSVRSAGDKVRVNVYLTDTRQKRQITANQYDRVLEDIFEVQDELTKTIAFNLRRDVKKQYLENLPSQLDEDLRVPELLDKAAGLFQQLAWDRSEAVRTLELAVEKAPDNAMAHAMLTVALWYRDQDTPLAPSEDLKLRMEAESREARRLDPSMPFALVTEALCTLQRGDPDLILELLHTAKSNSLWESARRNNLPLDSSLTMIEIQESKEKTALASLDPSLPIFESSNLCGMLMSHPIASYALGDTQGALTSLRKIDGVWPTARSHLLLQVACEQEFDQARAKLLVTKLKEEFPDLCCTNCKKPPFLDEACLTRFVGALLAAGLPD